MSFRLMAISLLLVPGLALAADGSDPDWPCVQRKVEDLSPGLMWPDPVAPAELSPAAQDLAAKLALRRVSLDEAQALINAYVAEAPDVSAETLGNIFLDVFKKLSRDRSRIIGGIGRYAHGQAALAAKIDAARVELDDLTGAEAPDNDKIDALDEQIAWDERIYTDRERSLTYVCETPVLVEKRLYAVAQMLQAAMPE
ncbi:MAG: hypothetical protein KDA73_10400 [Rhodobacteraceae bacterium]|nr:hypothetical protein [Paracoccaceae bacterium]